MSVDYEVPPVAQTVAESLTPEQRELLSGIFGSLALREQTVEPPFTGAVHRDDLRNEVTKNFSEAYGDNDFTTMDFLFVLETLAAAKAVTIYPEGLVRTGNHTGSDVQAVTLLGSGRMTRQQRLLRSMRSQQKWGPSGCLDH